MIMNIEKILLKIQELIFEHGPRFLAAIVILILGWIAIKFITRWFKILLVKREVNESLVPFLRTMLNMTLKTLLVVSVMGMMGIEMTSFIAIIGAAGLAIGMALSGTLQNFAGGVMILLFKPFKVGDFIDAKGYMGRVAEIQIFNTILKTPDNKTIIIPNGGLSTSSMVNFSTEEMRRVDLTYGISYGDSYEKAKDVLMSIITADERIVNEPAEPFIALHTLGDSSVNIVVRIWVKASNYWDVYFHMNETVYSLFPKEGLNIPFPQMDVHLKQDK